MIRLATPADVTAIVRMAVRFLESPDYRAAIVPDPAALKAVVGRLITGTDSDIFVAASGDAVVGMLAMHLFVHPFSGDRVASELAWWVEPEHRGAGVRLLRAAEAWAATRGADVMHMIAPSPKVEHFYESVGYTPIERLYQRRVSR